MINGLIRVNYLEADQMGGIINGTNKKIRVSYLVFLHYCGHSVCNTSLNVLFENTLEILGGTAKK